ncbi:hypothetical protein GF374_02345 [Candidatus Woesearchaeota archaeon]|nr:hypothetical protein [Candidatus Woesearchaeota archaeon]
MAAKKHILIFISFIFLLFLFQGVFALGISPPIYKIKYAPGEKHTFHFTLYGEPFQKIKLSAGGPSHTTAISLSETEFKLNAIGKYKFDVDLVVPEISKPGKKIWRITAKDNSENPGGISARVAMTGLINTLVPYPQKYMELKSFDAGNTKVGDPVKFTAKLESYGEKTIDEVSGNVEIFSPTGDLLETIQLSSEYNVQTEELVKLTSLWDTTNRKLGLYKAKANIYYDGNPINAETEFRIGDILLEITNINVTELPKNAIVKVPFTVKSKWGNNIPNVYGEVKLQKNDEILAETTTASVIMDSWSEKTINAYLDTTDLDTGDYTLSVTVFYEGKTAEKSRAVKVVSKSFLEYDNETIIAMLLVAIIIILGLAYYKKKKKLRKNWELRSLNR